MICNLHLRRHQKRHERDPTYVYVDVPVDYMQHCPYARTSLLAIPPNESLPHVTVLLRTTLSMCVSLSLALPSLSHLSP